MTDPRSFTDPRSSTTGPARRRRTTAELAAFEGHHVDDLHGERVDLLIVGINPGLMTAATNTHFAHPSNRFYKAMWLAGVLADPLPPDGLDERQRALLTERGIAITNLVARATARASSLTRQELQAGGRVLVEKVARWQPAVVAVAGLTAYRTAFDAPRAVVGEQPNRLAGARLWVVPNPSGLNAHETAHSLALAYRQAAVAAGLAVGPLRERD